MDILDQILEQAATKWSPEPITSYDDGYCCVRLSSESDSEYQVVARPFESYCVVKYVKRVQNPFQLALFQIAEEKKKADGNYHGRMKGYHVIYEQDMSTALAYPLDYRRYQHLLAGWKQQDGKEPRFYADVQDAIDAFGTTGTSDASSRDNKLILVCDVITDCRDNIRTSSQADYNVNYVVCIE